MRAVLFVHANRFFVLLFITFISLTARATQANLEIGEPFVHNFEQKEFKGHMQVFSIVQDHRGVLYFGTGAELLEYDGNRWRRIETLRGSDIRSLAVDSNGTVYIGGNSEIGYLATDLSGEIAYRSLTEKVSEKNRGFKRVDFTLATSHGIYFFSDKETLRWHDGKMTALISEKINSVVPAVINDSVYFYTPKGIAKIHDGTISVLPGSILPGEDLGAIRMFPFVDSQHLLLWSNKLGLLLADLGSSPADPNRSPFTSFANELTPYLKENPPSLGVAILSSDQIAIGTQGGGIVIVNRHGELTQVINKNRGLLSDYVNCLLRDNQGNLWVGMTSEISYVLTSSPFTLFGERSGLTSIDAVTRHQNTIYAGTYENGPKMLPPYRMSTKDDKHQFVSPTGEKKFYGFDFLSLGKALLVASDPVRVIEDSAIKDIENTSVAYNLSISKRFDRYIFFSPSAINGSGVGIIEVTPPISEVVSRDLSPTFKYKGKLTGINEQLRRIVPDDDGNLWLETQLSGLIHVKFAGTDIEHPEITRYSTKDGLPAMNWNNIYLNKDTFLVGTQKGIYRANPPRDAAHGRFRFEPATDIQQSYGNLSEAVGEIAGYIEDSLLIAFMHRNMILIKNSGASYHADLRTFSRIEGQMTGLHVDPDGVIWIPTVDGLYRYNPQIKKDYEIPYATVIRSVKTKLGRLIFKGTYFDEAVRTGDYFLKPSLTQPKQLVPTIEYAENGFIFEYSTLFFEHMEYNRYQVFLKGFDADWSEWLKDVKKEYTNIPEGSYVFQVRAKNIYDSESQIAEYRFIVKPPWYRTWGAYLGYGMLFLVAVYASSLLLRRRLIAAKNKLERIVKERTFEIVTQKTEIERQKGALEIAYQEVNKTKEALWGEMALAKKIQTVLLPNKLTIPGYELIAYMNPADEVGGDYYDVIHTKGTNWVVIGDVSGHGVPAGLIMMMVQTAIHAALDNNHRGSPANILESVNRIIYQNINKLGESKYMTITLLSVQESGTLSFSGMHQDILVYRATSNNVEPIKTNGIWIGIMEDIEELLDVQEFTLNPGDVMLLFTDGITEARDNANKLYSSEKLSAVFKEFGQKSVDEIGQGILSTLDGYTCEDDVTFVIIKRNRAGNSSCACRRPSGGSQ